MRVLTTHTHRRKVLDMSVSLIPHDDGIMGVDTPTLIKPHIKYIQFFVYHLYLNKAVKKKREMGELGQKILSGVQL